MCTPTCSSFAKIKKCGGPHYHYDIKHHSIEGLIPQECCILTTDQGRTYYVRDEDPLYIPYKGSNYKAAWLRLQVSITNDRRGPRHLVITLQSQKLASHSPRFAFGQPQYLPHEFLQSFYTPLLPCMAHMFVLDMVVVLQMVRPSHT